MKLLDEKGLTTVWAAIKNTFTRKSDADEKYAEKSKALGNINFNYTAWGLNMSTYNVDGDSRGYINITPATSTIAGVMTASDKAKLDGIASGANNYSLPIASTDTLGGVKTSVGYAPVDNWPIYADPNNRIYTQIFGLHNANDSISSVEIYGDQAGGPTTTYNVKGIVINSQDINSKTISFPSKAGTFALLSDIPDVSNLCKFNFINSISECKSDRINFLFRCKESNIDLAPFDDYPDGTILLITGTADSTVIRHSSGDWFNGGYKVGATNTDYMSTENIKLITKYGGKVHYYNL